LRRYSLECRSRADAEERRARSAAARPAARQPGADAATAGTAATARTAAAGTARVKRIGMKIIRETKLKEGGLLAAFQNLGRVPEWCKLDVFEGCAESA